MSLLGRAAALRAQFDHGFAVAPSDDAAATTDYLAIRAGAAPHALRLADLAGLFADHRIAPLPSDVPGLLGLAGFRGAIVPVYDLRRLLGCSTAAPPRWLVIAACEPVGFAFDALDGHLRLTAADLTGALIGGPVPRPVIDVAALVAALPRRLDP